MSAVLIVDDSPADRALFRTILTRAGYTVHEVGAGPRGDRQGRARSGRTRSSST